MKITRDNYEEFFVDYLDGNLDESLYDPFIEFLQSNPDLKEELKSLAACSPEPEEVVFAGKEKLYKSKYDSPKEFDFTSVAAIEGDLETSEEISFREYLAQNPEKEKEFETFKKAKLVADETVVFTNKLSLYKVGGVSRFLFYTSKIAAVLVLIFSVGVLFRHYSEVETPAEKIMNQISETVDLAPAKTQPMAATLPGETEAAPTTLAIAPVSEPKVQPETNAVLKQDDEITNRDTEPFAELTTIRGEVGNNETPLQLAAMNPIKQQSSELGIEPEGERPMLGDVIKEKAGIEGLTFRSVAKAGLKLVAGISKNKVSYDTNPDGNITEVSFESRLLAFSIPVQNSRSGE